MPSRTWSDPVKNHVEATLRMISRRMGEDGRYNRGEGSRSLATNYWRGWITVMRASVRGWVAVFADWVGRSKTTASGKTACAALRGRSTAKSARAMVGRLVARSDGGR